MPTDVNGTINIIAEVVGRGQTSPGAAKDILKGKNKKRGDDNAKSIFGIALEMKTLRKILGVAGLLGSSKIVSSSIQTILRIVGTLVDVVLMPLVPILARCISVFGKIVNFVGQMQWKGWGQLWNDLKRWWENQWEEKGGLWGIISSFFQDASAAVITAALLASVVKGPGAGRWILENTFGKAIGWGLSFTKKLFGLTKTFVSTVARAAAWAGGRILTGAEILARLLGKTRTGMLLKSWVLAAFGFVGRWGSVAMNQAWKSALFAKTIILSTIVQLVGALGLTPVWNKLKTIGWRGAIGGTAGKVALIAVGALVVVDILLRLCFGRNVGDVINTLLNWSATYDFSRSGIRIKGDPGTTYDTLNQRARESWEPTWNENTPDVGGGGFNLPTINLNNINWRNMPNMNRPGG